VADPTTSTEAEGERGELEALLAGSEAVVEGVGVAAAMAESVVAALGAAGALVWAGCGEASVVGAWVGAEEMAAVGLEAAMAARPDFEL